MSGWPPGSGALNAFRQERSDRQARVRLNDFGTLKPPDLGAWEPRLSVRVVIPAHGGQNKLDLTLAGLAVQTYPAHLMEVVVVDDRSTPPLRLPEIRPAGTRLVVSHEDGWGSSHAVHCGVLGCEADVVHRIDADMILYREHIETMMRWHHLADYLVPIGYKRFVAFSSGHVSAEQVYEAVADGNLDDLFDVAGSRPSNTESLIEETDGLRTCGSMAYMACTGPTVSFTPRLYDQAGGMNGRLVLGGDSEFAYRLAQAGAVFIPDPLAKSLHLGMPQMSDRAKEGARFREPYARHRIPNRRRQRLQPGRQWLVPYVDVIVDATASPFEHVRNAVLRSLASTLPDIRVTLVGPWSSLERGRRPLLDDPQLDLRLIHETFVHDARVDLVETVDRTSAPIPFRFVCPPGWGLVPQALERLTSLAEEHNSGTVLLALPAQPSLLTARLERTAAVSRALTLASDHEDLSGVVDEVFGVRWISGTEWAMVPTTVTSTPGPPGDHSELEELHAEVERWRLEALRLKQRLQEPLSIKVREAARRRLARWARRITGRA